MSRIRTVKPEFFRSASLARCCIPARLTFEGLWTEADDLGRGVADAKVLAGLLWPHDDDIDAVVVESHLRELASTGHIELYVVEEKRHFLVRNFGKHQAAALRRGEGKHPGPEEGTPWSEPPVVILHDDACKQHESACVGVLEGIGKDGSGGEGNSPAATTQRRVSTPRAPKSTPEARALVDDWWEAHKARTGRDPTGQKYVAVAEVVTKVLNAHPAEDVRWALDNAATISTGALEFTINRRKQQPAVRPVKEAPADQINRVLGLARPQEQEFIEVQGRSAS